MRILTLAALVVGSILFQGCTAFNPYISQPKEYGTFQAALNDLQKVQDDLDSQVNQQHLIGSLSSLGTFLGFGGAAISAIFHASRASILGFASGGATSLAVNGLYANPARTAIYNAGLDAVACISDAIGPLTKHDADLKAALKNIQDGVVSVKSRFKELEDLGRQVSENQRNAMAQVLSRAENTERLIGEKISEEDIRAPAITSAIRSVVASANKQLSTAIPDAAAFARAGSSLGSQVLPGKAQAWNNKAQTGSKTPPKTIAEMSKAPGDPDRLLGIYIINLQIEINEASDVIMADVTAPAISCKVADAPPIAPITVVLPDPSRGITYQTGATLNYSVTGGTPPYMGVQWAGAPPQCYTAVIHSPNTLVLSPTTTGTPPATTVTRCTSGQTFNFDIYDVHGQHMAKTVTVTTTP